MLTEAGFYDIPEAEYHADPCPEPSLSSSIAKVLLKRSPKHARHAHPRLNPSFERGESTSASDIGAALHKLILGKGADIVVIDAGDWRKDVNKAARADAHGCGKIPVLTKEMVEIEKCISSVYQEIQNHEDGRFFYSAGVSEQTMIWQEGPIWCRALVDRTPSDITLPLYDLKTTKMSAAPQDYERRLSSEYAIQAAFYERGARALGRKSRSPMLFIVIEQEAPFGMSVMAADPTLQAVAERDVERAIALWTKCMSTNEWPGYPRHTAYVAAKPWQLNDLMENME
jgi:PDDEXK-like domain of unknown function (DUF3799)